MENNQNNQSRIYTNRVSHVGGPAVFLPPSLDLFLMSACSRKASVLSSGSLSWGFRGP